MTDLLVPLLSLEGATAEFGDGSGDGFGVGDSMAKTTAAFDEKGAVRSRY